ncbi:unnamed protein product [Ambrosiozyma monospora]|uniref:Unnamed protein product n=1 Tax=Ambrosiozyma monospora TaxID=43982 RepID=A0ACB5SVP2_AMBMO|nr:unnamed protein product [Ambrosiozyma monospora]
MTTYDSLPPRGKSQRLLDKANKEKTKSLKLQQLKHQKPINKPTVTDLYPGLNEITDAFQAFPSDLIRYFTLLKEIDAKCVYTVPHLKAYIQRFLQMKKTHPKRDLLLSRIRTLIKDLMPCLEEKMHVATIASDSVSKHLKRINQAYEIIEQHEIPESVRIGPMFVPCMKITEPKSAQTQRSETRREALAAKKKKNGQTAGEDTDDVDDTPSTRTTPGPSTHHSTKKTNSRKRGDASSTNHGAPKRRKTNNSHANANNSSSKDATNGSADGVKEEHGITQSSTSSGTTTSKRAKSTKPKSKSTAGNSTSNNNAGGSNGSNKSSNGNGSSGSSGHAQSNSSGSTNSKKTNSGSSSSRSSRKDTHSGNGANGHGGAGASVVKQSTTTASKPVVVAAVAQEEYAGLDSEPVYCYCQQVSYGEMVGCDGENCEKEWFHLPCTGLTEPPKGEWYCDDCKAKMKKHHGRG